MNENVWFERFLIVIVQKIISKQIVIKFFVTSIWLPLVFVSESKLSEQEKLIYGNWITQTQFQKYSSCENILAGLSR